MDQLDWAQQLLKTAILFTWLFFMLPIFNGLHQRFSLQVLPSSIKGFSPLDWFIELWRVLGQKSTQQYSLQENFLRHILILIWLTASTTILSVMPLSAPWPTHEGGPILLNNATDFSLFFVLSLFFFMGFVCSAIGFSLGANLMPLTALEQFFSRQSIVLVIAFACISIRSTRGSDNLQTIALDQLAPLLPGVPSWGVLVNPIGFISACIALSFYTRQWFDNEVATQGILRKPIETRLVGTLLISFKIARSLEYLALYALITTVFLAGPLINTYQINSFAAYGIFILKLFFLVAIVLGISHLLPRLRDAQLFRIMLLFLLPLTIFGYFSSMWLTELLVS